MRVDQGLQTVNTSNLKNKSLSSWMRNTNVYQLLQKKTQALDIRYTNEIGLLEWMKIDLFINLKITTNEYIVIFMGS